MTWALAEGREKALVIASSTADSKLVAANGDFQAAAMHALEPRVRQGRRVRCPNEKQQQRPER